MLPPVMIHLAMRLCFNIFNLFPDLRSILNSTFTSEKRSSHSKIIFVLKVRFTVQTKSHTRDSDLFSDTGQDLVSRCSTVSYYGADTRLKKE